MSRGNLCPSNGSDVHRRCSLMMALCGLSLAFHVPRVKTPRSSDQEVATFLRHVFKNAALELMVCGSLEVVC
jgi:hypothetical protein